MNPLRVYALLFVLLAALPAAAAAVDGADAILGLWETAPTDKGHARVEIRVADGVYRGRIVWLSEPEFPAGDPQAGEPKVDRLNPDPEVRGRPILGLPLMEGFRYEGDRVWKGGRIYDPETGKTYRSNIRLDEDGSLKVRGFVGISLLGRTTVWVRPRSR